jgi:4,5-dihydroxyphthalate decarboxylase
MTMLGGGVIDAAIVDPIPAGPRFLPVVSDPEATFGAWQQRHRAATVNHVIVVRESLATNDETMRELFRLFRESWEMAGATVDRVSAPLGLEANRRNLEVAIAAADAQGLLARPLTVDDLVTDATASLQ